MEVIFCFVFLTSTIGLVQHIQGYEVFKYNSMNYGQAKSHCESRGDHLAFIKTNEDLAHAIQYITGIGGLVNDVYIGMIWDRPESKFKWLDDDTVTFADWALNISPAEPNCMSGYQSCRTGGQDCVRMTTTYTLKTVTCSSSYDVMCGMPEFTTVQNDVQTSPATSIGFEATSEDTSGPSTIQNVYLLNSDVEQTTTESTSGITTYSTNMTSQIVLTQNDLVSTESSKTTVYHPVTMNTGGWSQETSCNSYTNNSISCVCAVNYVNSKWHAILHMNLTDDELHNIVKLDFEKNIKPHISVDKEQLSSYQRLKSSASDDRTSSVSIGWAAIFFLLLPMVLAVIIDIISFVQNFQDNSSDLNENTFQFS